MFEVSIKRKIQKINLYFKTTKNRNITQALISQYFYCKTHKKKSITKSENTDLVIQNI